MPWSALDCVLCNARGGLGLGCFLVPWFYIGFLVVVLSCCIGSPALGSTRGPPYVYVYRLAFWYNIDVPIMQPLQ